MVVKVVAVANAFDEMEAEMAVEMAVALAVVTDAETEVAAQTEVVLCLRWQGCRGVSWCLVDGALRRRCGRCVV